MVSPSFRNRKKHAEGELADGEIADGKLAKWKQVSDEEGAMRSRCVARVSRNAA